MEISSSSVAEPAGRKLARIRSAIRRFESQHEDMAALRDYQGTALIAVGAFFRDSMPRIEKGEVPAGAIVMPSGSGKTVLAAEIVRRLGLRSLIIAPTVKIALQDFDEI